MIKVYAVALGSGVIALIVVILGGALAEIRGWKRALVGRKGRLALGGLLGFGMGGMASEFSPLGPTWPVSLSVAVVAAVIGLLWVRYSSSTAP